MGRFPSDGMILFDISPVMLRLKRFNLFAGGLKDSERLSEGKSLSLFKLIISAILIDNIYRRLEREYAHAHECHRCLSSLLSFSHSINNRTRGDLNLRYECYTTSSSIYLWEAQHFCLLERPIFVIASLTLFWRVIGQFVFAVHFCSCIIPSGGVFRRLCEVSNSCRQPQSGPLVHALPLLSISLVEFR